MSTTSNRVAWDRMASTWYAGRLALKAKRLAASRTGTLERFELQFLNSMQLAGPVVHLQCADGSDTLSILKLEGVTNVIGLDFSERMLACAAQLSASNDASVVEWVHADVLAPPTSLTDAAELVYTGKGSLPWVSDIDRWASTVSRILRPGGVLFLWDLHPLAALFRQDTSELVATGASYFDSIVASAAWPDGYGGSQAAGPRKVERVWSPSSVVDACLRAGLGLEQFLECAEAYWDDFPCLTEGLRATFPKTFVVIARKPSS